MTTQNKTCSFSATNSRFMKSTSKHLNVGQGPRPLAASLKRTATHHCLRTTFFILNQIIFIYAVGIAWPPVCSIWPSTRSNLNIVDSSNELGTYTFATESIKILSIHFLTRKSKIACSTIINVMIYFITTHSLYPSLYSLKLWCA